MKTSYKIIKMLLAILMLGLLVSTAMAQGHQSLSFLNGYNLQVTQTSTNVWGATNTYAKGYTVTNSATYPYVSSASPTYWTNAYWTADVLLWANRDGTAPNANISAQIVGVASTFTNTATFRFAAVPVEARSSDYPAGTFTNATAGQNLFSFSVTGNGTTNVCIATNLPTSFLQGNRAIRLSSIEWSNAGTNGAVVGLFLNGYKPD